MKRLLTLIVLAAFSGAIFAQTSTQLSQSCIDGAGNLKLVYDISDPSLICSSEASLAGAGSIGFHSGADNFGGTVVGYDDPNAKSATEIAPGVFQLTLNIDDYYGYTPANIQLVFNQGVGNSNPWDTVGRDTLPGTFGCSDLLLDLADVGSCVCDNSQAVTGLESDVSGGMITLSWCPVPASVGCRVTATLPTGGVGAKNIIGTGVRSFSVPSGAVPSGTYVWGVACACDFGPPPSVTPPSAPNTFVNPAPRLGTSSEMTVFPNPAVENINVTLEVESAQNTQLMIMDISGKMVDMTEVQLEAGQNNISLDVSFLETGLYVLQTADGSAVHQFAVSK